jgi:anti-repressor protein
LDIEIEKRKINYLYKIILINKLKSWEDFMELQSAKKKIFEGFEIECFEDVSNDNGDFYMTRKQIGEALDYKNEKQLNVVIFRHKEEIGNSVGFKLKSTDEKYYDTEVYSFNQLFQILRFSKQPKANLFMDWATITLKELILGRAELKFSNDFDKEKYESKIKELEDQLVELEDLADGYKKLFTAPNTQDMLQASKSFDLGRTKLFAFLRKSKVLMKDNMPYQKHITAGHFKVREAVIPTGEVVTVTLVTGKGMNYIRKKLEKVDFAI